ncbi:MAG: TetR/AcrR family transcriptional regulator [Actinomycetota bacterium]
MRTDARERMIASAIWLFRQHGYEGTGFRDVIEHSGAPRGSIYHHFPGGKSELGVEAVRWAGEFLNRLLGEVLASEGPTEGLGTFIRWWTDYVESRGFRAGCPVVGVAVASRPEAPELAEAATTAFKLWERTLAAAFHGHGLGMARSRDLASLVVGALEGATIMSRASRTTEPLERVARELTRTTAASFPKE